ncbi:MAG: shikimate kinase, partial [Lachnospiraceae bacterium]|nr:shikimate kinase [Lachnospiraceae bacterium]
MSLILEGFMGSGKSAVGRTLALRLGLPFLDTDSEIEARQSCRIADIFEKSGEEAFRQMETSMLQGLLLSDAEAVISLGGGTPARKANVPVIKKLGRVIYLKASVDTLVRRLESGTEERPMLRGHDLRNRVEELLRYREDMYISLADTVI